MSTDYRSEPPLRWDNLWADLPPGVTKAENAKPVTERQDCITDGRTWLWVYSFDGEVEFTRYGVQKHLDDFLQMLADHYQVTIASTKGDEEYKPAELQEES